MARSPEPLASHHVRWDWSPAPLGHPCLTVELRGLPAVHRRSRRRPIAAGVAVACGGNRARRLGADGACALSSHDAPTVAQESARHMTRASHFVLCCSGADWQNEDTGAPSWRDRPPSRSPTTSMSPERPGTSRRTGASCESVGGDQGSGSRRAGARHRCSEPKADAPSGSEQPLNHQRTSASPQASARTLDRVMPGRTALWILQFGCPAPSALTGTSRKTTRSEQGGAAWR